MKKYLLVAGWLVLAACGGNDEPAKEVTMEAPLKQSAHSEEFNSQFGKVLNNYYSLKDALVATNDTTAANAARQLEQTAAELALNGINADSSIVQMAEDYVKNIESKASQLATQPGIEEKRKTFQGISSDMYDLVRTVRYDNEVVYHQYCPMAFNDAGAYWLSNSSDIKNPYFGKKMLHCGEVKDSLDFAAQVK